MHISTSGYRLITADDDCYLIGMGVKYKSQDNNELEYISMKLSNDIPYDACESKVNHINKSLLEDKKQYSDNEPSMLYLEGAPCIIIDVVAKQYLQNDTLEEYVLDENNKKVKPCIVKRYMFNEKLNEYTDISMLKTNEEMLATYEAWSTATIH